MNAPEIEPEKTGEGAAGKLAVVLHPQKQFDLFPNRIDTQNAFGISRTFADGLKKLTEKITPEAVAAGFSRGGEKVFITKIGKENVTGLRVRDEKNEIKTADQLYQALSKIKSGKLIKDLLILWDYANQKGNFVFNGTKLTAVLETFRKKPKSGYFSQKERQEFSESIHRLRDFEIYLDQIVEDKDGPIKPGATKKNKGKKMIQRDFHRLIDLVGARYSIRKTDLKDATGRVLIKKGHADDRVIVRLYGELLPSFNKMLMRGRLYSRGILDLDAGRDERAILLGFKLLTRFDQLRQGETTGNADRISDKDLFVEMDRKTLIEWAGYEGTNDEDKWTASHRLCRTLDKLIAVRCINSYLPKEIGTDDSLKIKIFPHPIALSQDEQRKVLLDKREKREERSKKA